LTPSLVTCLPWSPVKPLRMAVVDPELTLACRFDSSRSAECLVNKKDLVGKIASDAQLTRSQATLALDAFLEGIQTSLVKGDRVTIAGFGTFGVSHRKARKVRNPKSGRAIEIAAKRVPRFAPGVEFKSAMELAGEGFDAAGSKRV
jgi:DNA-binding protein HU-beta